MFCLMSRLWGEKTMTTLNDREKGGLLPPLTPDLVWIKQIGQGISSLLNIIYKMEDGLRLVEEVLSKNEDEKNSDNR